MLSACDAPFEQAQHDVHYALHSPATADFRDLKMKDGERVVCGEVSASDRPDAGWRRFVVYLDQSKAVVAPASGLSPEPNAPTCA